MLESVTTMLEVKLIFIPMLVHCCFAQQFCTAFSHSNFAQQFCSNFAQQFAQQKQQ